MGTVKAAVIDGITDLPGIVAALVYETKPVHFLSIFCNTIKWFKKYVKCMTPYHIWYVTLNFCI